ncbi:probable polygalacturonase At3g15720 [Phaseolus vulgaris]
MQSLIICALILAFISPFMCIGLSATMEAYNVIDFGAKGDGKTDDSQAFLRAWERTCGAEGMTTLLIPPNYEFLLSRLTLKGPCNASRIQIQIGGKIVAPAKNKWVSYYFTWILMSNVNGLIVDGREGLLDGLGFTWWPCKACQRPSVISFNACNDLRVSYLRIVNSPRSHINVNDCVNAIFSAITIHSPANSPNTDGFNVYASKNIWIRDSTIASGDDCIGISGNSSYINVTEIACGPGHGISIGSLGRGNDNTAEQIYVRNCSFTNTTNGARIKTFPNGSGYAREITFEEIKLIKAGNPIIIDQFYNDYSPKDEGVEVSGITFRGFDGTCVRDKAITLNCGPQGCFNITLDEIKIVSHEEGKQVYCSGKNAHGTVTATTPNCSCLSP